MKPLHRFAIALLLSTAVSVAVPAAQTHGYRVTRRIPVEGDGFWDYLTVDEAGRRLYVAHGTRVQVVDIDVEPATEMNPRPRRGIVPGSFTVLVLSP